MPCSGLSATPERWRRSPPVDARARTAPGAPRAAAGDPSRCLLVGAGNSTANSSPPSRATVSPPAEALVRRRPTCCSNPSPDRWPSVSLISLKRSRSISSRASGDPCAGMPNGHVESVAQKYPIGQSGKGIVQRLIGDRLFARVCAPVMSMKLETTCYRRVASARGTALPCTTTFWPSGRTMHVVKLRAASRVFAGDGHAALGRRRSTPARRRRATTRLRCDRASARWIRPNTSSATELACRIGRAASWIMMPQAMASYVLRS